MSPKLVTFESKAKQEWWAFERYSPLYRQTSRDSLQHRVGTETLPTPSIAWFASYRPDGRTKIDIATFASELLADGHPTLIHQALIESRPCSYTRREDGAVVCLSYAERRVLDTQLRKANSRSTSCHANADPVLSVRVVQSADTWETLTLIHISQPSKISGTIRE